MGALTLEHGGVEKSFADWGISLAGAGLEEQNLALSTYRFSLAAANITADPFIGFEAKVIIRGNRTGSGTSYSGGFVKFIGWRLDVVLDGRPEWQGGHYTFGNAWYWLASMLYQQPRSSITVAGQAFPFTTDLALFQRLNTSTIIIAPITNGEQITDILTYALSVLTPFLGAAPFAIGTIAPDLDLPVYNCKEVSCAAAIAKCLELSPECTLDVDYTTTTGGGAPLQTLNVIARSARTARTLALANGTDHKAIRIAPRPTLQLRSVVIFFRITYSDNGVAKCAFVKDKYGPHGANHASDPEAGPRVLLQTFDLQGGSFNQLSALLDSATCHANTGATNNANRLNFWRSLYPELALAGVSDLSVENATITAAQAQDGYAAGAAVPLAAFPYQLHDTMLADWMTLSGGTPAAAIRVKIEAVARYKLSQKASTNGHARPTHDYTGGDGRKLYAYVTLTNAPAGLYRTSESSGGEEVPTGIAQKIYEAMSVLQYSGEDVRVRAAAQNDAGNGPLIKLGNTLNLSGGRSEWASMAAQVQSIRTDDGAGTVSITFGPASHLNVNDLAALWLYNRERYYLEHPIVRVRSY